MVYLQYLISWAKDFVKPHVIFNPDELGVDQKPAESFEPAKWLSVSYLMNRTIKLAWLGLVIPFIEEVLTNFPTFKFVRSC